MSRAQLSLAKVLDLIDAEESLTDRQRFDLCKVIASGRSAYLAGQRISQARPGIYVAEDHA